MRHSHEPRGFARAAGVLPDPAAIPLDVLHEDAHLLVLNKRPGIVVHPVGKQQFAGLDVAAGQCTVALPDFGPHTGRIQGLAFIQAHDDHEVQSLSEACRRAAGAEPHGSRRAAQGAPGRA